MSEAGSWTDVLGAVWEPIRATAVEIWHRASTPAATPDRTIVLTCLAVAVCCVMIRPLWALTRHGLTIVHEGGHAIVAVLTGRRLESIRLHADTSGLTVTRGRDRGIGVILTASAGYPAPAVVGVGAAWAVSTGWSVAALWIMALALCAILVRIRNWFGLLPVVATLTAVVVLAWLAPVSWQVAVACAIAWFALVGSLRPVIEMQSERRDVLRRRRRSTSDADLLGELTWFPAWAWVGWFAIVSVGCAGAGAWLLIRPVLS